MVLPTQGTAPQFTRTRAPHPNTNPLQGQAALARKSKDRIADGNSIRFGPFKGERKAYTSCSESRPRAHVRLIAIWLQQMGCDNLIGSSRFWNERKPEDSLIK